MSDAVTNSIRVEVLARHSPENSHPQQGEWMFEYTVRITNQGNDRVQLHQPALDHHGRAGTHRRGAGAPESWASSPCSGLASRLSIRPGVRSRRLPGRCGGRIKWSAGRRKIRYRGGALRTKGALHGSLRHCDFSALPRHLLGHENISPVLFSCTPLSGAASLAFGETHKSENSANQRYQSSTRSSHHHSSGSRTTVRIRDRRPVAIFLRIERISVVAW